MKKLDILNPFSDAPVYYRDVTGSTMDDCKKDSSTGILHGTVYQAGFQEKGRGRIKGRKWLSGSGLNLTFTLVLKRSLLHHELNLMPLIVGTALTNSVSEFTGLDFQLKWPNDLLYKGKKTAGILCEADNEYFYCGIGINCNQTLFSDELKNKVTSLNIITQSNINISRLLILILEKIQYYISSGELWRDKFDNLLYKKGELVEILEGRADDSTLIKGEILGIGSDGQLILKKINDIVVEIYAGEIEL